MKELMTRAFPQRSSRSTTSDANDDHSFTVIRSLLNESMHPDEADPQTISSDLIHVARDVVNLNRELARAIDASDSVRAQSLLALGANPNHIPSGRVETLLLTACYNGDSESVRVLLQANADPNQRAKGSSSNDNITPLMVAAERGMTEAVQDLLQFNADPHVRSISGETALLAAARTNNHDAFAALVGSMVST